MTTEVTGNILRRMLRASCFDTHIFEEVEADRSATKQALLVVAIVALSTGIASLTTNGLVGLFMGVLVGIVGWAIWAYIVYLIGTKLLGTSDTHADWGQLARTIGFAQSPGIFRALGALPTIGDTIFLVASIWILITTVIAVRQALDYTSTLRAVGVVLLGFIPYAIFMSLIVLLIGAE